MTDTNASMECSGCGTLPAENDTTGWQVEWHSGWWLCPTCVKTIDTELGNNEDLSDAES